MPNTRETLIELLKDGGVRDFPFNAALADYLIANGVTVQDGKPLEAFLHPIDAYKGLKAKYLVFKSDTGEKVDNCFILRPDKDSVAVEALRAYANATDNETLAEDIYNWIGKGEPVQEWIPVTERLPEKSGDYLAYCDNRYIGLLPYSTQYKLFNTFDGCGTRHAIAVTHWMPLPQPPKGE